MSNNAWYSHLAKSISRFCGRPYVFLTAILVIVVWLVSGPIFDYSDTWQLMINTATTIITFLMVFLIQNTQNRDTEAMQIKLDELIRAVRGAQNAILDLEELDEETLDKFREHYENLARQARKKLGKDGERVGTPEEIFKPGAKHHKGNSPE